MSADGEGTRVANGSGAPAPGSTSPAPQTASNNGTNGALKSSSTNGSWLTETGPTTGSRPTAYMGHDREEVTRLLIQALSGMGYGSIAKSLSQESGYELENPTVAAFRAAVLNGGWAVAEDLLSNAVFAGGPGAEENGLVLAQGSDKTAMRLWMRQQKFMELLEQRDTTRALSVLRSEITPLHCDTARVHFLSGLLMCNTPEQLKGKADWDGASGTSRHALLSELSSRYPGALSDKGIDVYVGYRLTCSRMHLPLRHAAG